MARAPRKPKEATPQEPMKLPNLAAMTAESIQGAYMAWMADNTPEVIQKKCIQVLDNSAGDILRKLLGFNKSTWNKEWELDHCNSRSGNSAAGDYIRQHQDAAVKKWLSQIPLPEMTETMKKSAMKEAQQRFTYKFNQEINELIDSYATRQALDFFNKVIDSQQSQVADQMKLLELLLQTNKEPT